VETKDSTWMTPEPSEYVTITPPNVLVKQRILFGKTAYLIADQDEMINDNGREKYVMKENRLRFML
jgi:hypothetical protein